MGYLAVLTFVVFLILKLTAVIHWAWWLVFLPLIVLGAGLAIWLVFAVLIGGVALVLHRKLK